MELPIYIYIHIYTYIYIYIHIYIYINTFCGNDIESEPSWQILDLNPFSRDITDRFALPCDGGSVNILLKWF